MTISQILLYIRVLRFVVDLIKGKEVAKKQFADALNRTELAKESGVSDEDVEFLMDTIRALGKD